MATIAKLSFCSSYYASIFFRDESASSPRTFSRPHVSKTKVSSLKLQASDQSYCLVKNMDTVDLKKMETCEKINEIHCTEEYDKDLQFSKEKLVIAHFSATHYKYNSRIHKFIEEQFGLSDEVKFLYVTTNKSEKTRKLCRRENIDKIPYFVLYKNTEKLVEVAGFQPKKLVRDILYYRDDPFSPVVELKTGEDFKKLIKAHKFEDKLIVVNVGKRRCVPCVKIYPSVLKLASQMAGEVLFARMNADENDGCLKTVREMDVQMVPAFLFFLNGELCGRYIGSCTSVLIREIVKLRNELATSAFGSKLLC